VVTPRTFLGNAGLRIDISDSIRASCHTVSATNASVGIDINNTIRALDGSDYRAYCHTNGFFAVIADYGQRDFLYMRVFSLFHFFYPASPNSQGDIIFTFADDGTCLASDTLPQVQQHGIALLGIFHDL
jgi:hypothetical protein